MALVTSDEARGHSRDVYVPSGERSMVHHSYLSPDGKWVLVVEMNNDGGIGPCRVIPFEGGGNPRDVGPLHAACTSGAWSPDGKWVYGSANPGGKFHIWRQRFPKGSPEQVTSGPTEEQGIAMAADGKSLVSAVGIEESSVWLHDAQGEHQISSEGYSGAPEFSPDFRQLYYLRSAGENVSPELRVVDLENGASRSVLSGYSLQICGVSGLQHYSLSRDGTKIAFSMADNTGQSRLWIAPTDRRTAPQKIQSRVGEDCPFFLPNGDLVFRAADGDTHFLYRMTPDGTERQKISTREILDSYGVSHDGRWILAQTRGPDSEHPFSVAAFPIDGGPIVWICHGYCLNRWDGTGKWLYLSRGVGEIIYALPLQPSGLPRLPPAGISNSEELALMKAPVIAEGVLQSGGTPSRYAYTSRVSHRNLYRIPLP